MPVLVDKISHGHHLFEEAKKEVARMRSEPNATSDNYIAIGLINNMPDSALVATERQVFALLRAAAGDDIPVHLKFYALPNVTRTDWGQEYMSRSYLSLDDLYDSKLDAVIVTGAEPQAPTLIDEPYWGGLSKVIDWAADTTTSAIWSCLAVHSAVLHLDGITRHPLGEKCIGIFEQKKMTDHPILEGTPTKLMMPHSRWNEIREEALLSCGYSVLTKSADAGVDTFIKQQRRSLFVFFQGHPEYEALSLFGEYRRDIGRFLRKEMEIYPTRPRGYFDEEAEEMLADFQRRALHDRRKELLATFPVEPISGSLTNTWRSASVSIYRNWLSHVSERKALKQ